MLTRLKFLFSIQFYYINAGEVNPTLKPQRPASEYQCRALCLSPPCLLCSYAKQVAQADKPSPARV